MELNAMDVYTDDDECFFCGETGSIKYKHNDTYASEFIVCNSCGASWVSAYCTNCKWGRIIKIPPEKPKIYEWKCKNCKSKNLIKPNVYLFPITLSPQKSSSSPKSSNKFLLLDNFLKFFFGSLAFIGATISILMHILLIKNGYQFIELDKLLYVLGIIPVMIYLREPMYYFRKLPWHGKFSIVVILIYLLWNVLNLLARNSVDFYETSILQAVTIGSYVFVFYLWVYVIK
jgi:hypothetical protein